MPKARHIVIADGCEMNRHLIKLALGAEGFHRLTETAHYPDALSVLRAYKTHLLILAQKIGGFSASEVIRQIRQGQSGCKTNIPIIVLADLLAEGGPWDHLSERGEAAGKTVFVAKPFSIRKLHPVMMDLLAGRKDPDSLERCRVRRSAGEDLSPAEPSMGMTGPRRTLQM